MMGGSVFMKSEDGCEDKLVGELGALILFWCAGLQGEMNFGSGDSWVKYDLGYHEKCVLKKI